MKRITSVKCTCEACPTQYDFYTEADDYIYFRFRHGRVLIEENNLEVYTCGDGDSGVMEFDRVKFHMREAGFDIPETFTHETDIRVR